MVDNALLHQHFISDSPSLEQPLWLPRDFLALLENASDFIYVKDAAHRFTSASLSFARLTGHDCWQDLIGKSDFDIFTVEHAQRYYKFERPVIELGHPLINHEEPYYDSQGTIRWVRSSKHPIKDDQGKVVGLVGISKDITDIKSYQATIKEMANYDELTGLANRHLFNEVFCKVLARAQRHGEKLALLYMDLDNFKDVNDKMGHISGDHLLKDVARCLQAEARECDLLARFGGDEFVLVISGKEDIEHCTFNIAQRLIAAIGRYCRTADTCCSKLGCSIGAAMFPKDGQTMKELLTNADTAMYKAKSIGKNNVQFFGH